MTNKPEHTAFNVELIDGKLFKSDRKFNISLGELWVKTEEDRRNAAFIVRACNSHYDLIDALEQIEQQLDYGQHSTAHKIAIDALEKARGEA